jgi:Ni/Co efflux regulator RcnB
MPGVENMRLIAAVLSHALCAALLFLSARSASAWGDEGHEVIGLIADHYLQPAVRARVQAMLAGDDTGLVAHDIAHEATWADKYRDSDRDTTKRRYKRTRDWHFVDLELDGLDVNRACDGRRPLPAGTDAANGPPDDCVIDKIDEFSAELKNPRVDPRERRLALQFLLHLIGDLHQPLHASDDHDQGGNRKLVNAPGIGANNLHHDWDTEFVAQLGASGEEIAQRLIEKITDAQRAQWSKGTPDDWAMETYFVSKTHAYGLLPAPSGDSYYRVSEQYVTDAIQVTAAQLSKAGVRLAFLLNQDLD